MKNLTPEMIEKAKAAKTAEELLELAKANGVEMTADEAATYFAQLNPKSGELNDDDLDLVSGGVEVHSPCLDKLEQNMYLNIGTDKGDAKFGAMVRLNTGETCPHCGTSVGIIGMGFMGGSGTAGGTGVRASVFCPQHPDIMIARGIRPKDFEYV